MPDAKGLFGGQESFRPNAREEREILAFARRHGMTPDEVRDMLVRIGDDPDALEREAAKLRRH